MDYLILGLFSIYDSCMYKPLQVWIALFIAFSNCITQLIEIVLFHYLNYELENID